MPGRAARTVEGIAGADDLDVVLPFDGHGAGEDHAPVGQVAPAADVATLAAEGRLAIDPRPHQGGAGLDRAPLDGHHRRSGCDRHLAYGRQGRLPRAGGDFLEAGRAHGLFVDLSGRQRHKAGRRNPPVRPERVGRIPGGDVQGLTGTDLGDLPARPGDFEVATQHDRPMGLDAGLLERRPGSARLGQLDDDERDRPQLGEAQDQPVATGGAELARREVHQEMPGSGVVSAAGAAATGRARPRTMPSHGRSRADEDPWSDNGDRPMTSPSEAIVPPERPDLASERTPPEAESRDGSGIPDGNRSLDDDGRLVDVIERDHPLS